MFFFCVFLFVCLFFLVFGFWRVIELSWVKWTFLLSSRLLCLLNWIIELSFNRLKLFIFNFFVSSFVCLFEDDHDLFKYFYNDIAFQIKRVLQFKQKKKKQVLNAITTQTYQTSSDQD